MTEKEEEFSEAARPPRPAPPSHEGQEKDRPEPTPEATATGPDPAVEREIKRLARRLLRWGEANAQPNVGRVYGVIGRLRKREVAPEIIGAALERTLAKAEAGKIKKSAPCYFGELATDWAGVPPLSDDYPQDAQRARERFVRKRKAKHPARAALEEIIRRRGWNREGLLEDDGQEETAARLAANNEQERERERRLTRRRQAEKQREEERRREEREQAVTEARTYRERRDAGETTVRAVSELTQAVAEAIRWQDAAAERDAERQAEEERRRRREELDAALRPHELRAGDLAKGNPERIRAVRAIVYPRSDGVRTEDRAAVDRLRELVESWGPTSEPIGANAPAGC